MRLLKEYPLSYLGSEGYSKQIAPINMFKRLKQLGTWFIKFWMLLLLASNRTFKVDNRVNLGKW